MARLLPTEGVPGLPTQGSPLVIGGVTLAQVSRGPETLVASFKGRKTVSALRPLGLYFPRPNRFESSDDATIIWVGPGRALLIGVPAPEGLSDGAALTDQTGAQAVVLISGGATLDVLARLVPIDLRETAFPVGSVALTLLGHMTAMVRRTEEGIEVAVMRSMAETLMHDLTEAANGVAARAAL